LPVQILPYIEQQSLGDVVKDYDRAGAPEALRQVFLNLYWCPSRENLDVGASFTYFGVMGAARNGDCMRGSVYERGGPGHLEQSHCGSTARDGVVVVFEHVSMKDITDGTSQTMILGERVYELRSYFNGARVISGNSIDTATKICVDAAKNMRWGITTPEEAGYYIWQGAEVPPGAPQTILFNDFFWYSDHPGVTLFAFADGSVQTIQNETDLQVLKNMATRNGADLADSLVTDDGSCFGAPPPQR
jgi:hypothetical protein